MNRKSFLMASLALLSSAGAFADPIHARTDGAFWHHDSGWVFPKRIGEFSLVGFPQDVAGSRDAVAHYVRDVNGVRTVASVDVYPADSAATHVTPAGGPFIVSEARALMAARSVDTAGNDASTALVGMYLVTAGEWRVSIRVSSPQGDAEALMDAFVLGQRWETLNSAT
jgi:hypothetical protein